MPTDAVRKVKTASPKSLQSSLEDEGEFVDDSRYDLTPSERVVASALADAGFQVVPHFFVAAHEFDFKIRGYQVLVEVDGSIHDNYAKRLKDLRKDRLASAKGFKVLRFSSDEPASVVVADVKRVVASLPRVPREVWLVDYSLWSRFLDWLRSW